MITRKTDTPPVTESGTDDIRLTSAEVRKLADGLFIGLENGGREPDEAPERVDIGVVPDHLPGQKAAALSGITEDLQTKELQGVVMNISFKTRYPKQAYAKIKAVVNLANGTIIEPVWSETGEICVKTLFPDLEQAKQAAYNIKLATNAKQRPNLKFAASDEKVQAFTFDGDLFTTGKGDIANAMAMTAVTEGNMKIYANSREQTLDPLKSVPGKVRSRPFDTTRLEGNSVRHASEKIRPPNVEIPDTGVLLQIHLPPDIQGDAAAKLISICIDMISSPNLTLKSMQGKVATLYIAGERSPGNVLKKLAAIQQAQAEAAATERSEDQSTSTLPDFSKLTFVADYGHYKVVRLDEGTYTIQGTQQREYHTKPMTPGMWVTQRFKNASGHERNLAAARCNYLDMRIDGLNLQRIGYIRSMEFEPVILGRETVGRDTELNQIADLLEDTKTNGHTNFLTVVGPAGIGKTDLIKRAFDTAKEQKLRTTYYKIMEDGPVQHSLAVRKLIQGIWGNADARTQNAFLDLKLFADEKIPAAHERDYGQAVRILRNDHEYLGERLAELLTKGADMVIVDDCQWLDEFSLKALNKAVDTLPQQSGTMVVLVGRSKDEPLPESLTASMKARKERHTTIMVKELKDSDIENCIRAHLPENFADARVIPENFVRKIAAISHGIPFVITEILSLFVLQKEISLEGDTLIVPSDERLDQLAKSSISETLSNIIQTKFSKLTIEELEIIDYLAVVGETEPELFEAILHSKGIPKARTKKIIASLEEQMVVRQSPRLCFLYDQTASERKRQVENRKTLSKTAATCYETLHANQERYPEYITPTLLFRMLAIAAEHPEQLDEIQRSRVSRDYLPQATSAIDHCMEKSQNLQTIDIAERIMPAIDKLAKTLETKTDEEKATIGRYLYNIYLRVCRANLRVARAREAKAALAEIEALDKKVPQAGILKDRTGTTPLHAIPYYVLQASTAFAFRNPEDMQNTNTALSTAVSELKSKLAEDDPTLVLANGELLLARLRKVLLQEDHEALSNMEQNPETAKIQRRLSHLKKRGDNEDLRKKAHILSLDITRQITQMRGRLVVFRSIEGKTGEETLFLQEVSDRQRTELQSLKEVVDKLIEIYENDPSLLPGYEHYAHLLDTATRIEFLLANTPGQARHRENAETLVKKALRLGQGLSTPQFAARIRLLKGNFLTGQTLKTAGLNVAEWDRSTLRDAVDQYNQGYSEMLRINAADEMTAVTNSQNGAMAFAMYVLAETDQPTESQTADIADLAKELTATYQRTCKSLETVKRAYYDRQAGSSYHPEPFRDIYRNELATLGLLHLAASKLRISLSVPDYIQTTMIAEAASSLKAVEQTPNLTRGDQILLELRREGLSALRTQL